MREEKDLLGSVQIEDTNYYGVQTVRAMELGGVRGYELSAYPYLLRAAAILKKAAANANKDIGALDPAKACAISRACDEMKDGRFDDQFPVGIFAGGGGISLHMNINEVLANRANEILTGAKGYDSVHPNTHVNMGQSTNDVIPSAMKLATYFSLKDLVSECENAQVILDALAEKHKDTVKVSRTCVQDAVPITMGQYLGGICHLVKRQTNALQERMAESLSIPLGATAVGTGLGAFAGYREQVMRHLAEETGLPIRAEEDLFDGLQNTDFYVTVSATLKALAFGLSKFARDLRLLSSGPRAGIGEIAIEAVQNGSSIMPGKVNPALPELMNMVAYQVAGNDAAINMACEGGELELNVWEGIHMINLFSSCKLLTESLPLFSERCVKTMQVCEETCEAHAEHSMALAVVVSAMLGYEKGCEVAALANEENLTIREAVLQLGYMDEKTADEVLDPLMLTDPEKSGALLLKLHQNSR